MAINSTALNYSAYQPTVNPLGGIEQGMNLAQAAMAGEKRQLEMQEYQRALQLKAQMQQDMAKLSANPSPQAYAEAINKYPSMSEALTESYNMLNAEQQKTQVNFASNVYSAISANRSDIAERLIQERIDATEDPQQKAALKANLEILKVSPEAARTTSGLFLANALGPEKFAENYEKMMTITGAPVDKRPAKVQELEWRAEAAGLKKGTPEYNKFMINGGSEPAPLVTIGGTEESSFAKELGKTNVQMFSNVWDQGSQASRSMRDLDDLDRLLESTPQGFMAFVYKKAGDFGIETEGLDDMQALDAIINRLIPSQRAPGSGTMSDVDVEMYRSSLPKLRNQPGGNKLIISTLKDILRYDIQRSEIANQVLSGELKPAEGRRKLNALQNPLENYTGGKPIVVSYGGKDYPFPDKKKADEFKRRLGIK